MLSTSELKQLDLIDLLSERHNLVRKITENVWNDNHELPISNSEWYIMAIVYGKRLTIADVTKNVEISRQAIHKLIQNLRAKGLVNVQNVENNRKLKCIELTALGKDCYEKYVQIKAQLEKDIMNKIGESHVNELKNILSMDWGI